MKPKGRRNRSRRYYVALRRRAWIETSWQCRRLPCPAVALRRRAWIETGFGLRVSGLKGSPSAGGRGLKPAPSMRACRPQPVALRRRAWIETLCSGIEAASVAVALRRRAWIETASYRQLRLLATKSPSAGGRGLKHFPGSILRQSGLSPSAGGRGLKLGQGPPVYADLWSPSAGGRGLKRAPAVPPPPAGASPSAGGRGLKLSYLQLAQLPMWRRPPQEGVD